MTEPDPTPPRPPTWRELHRDTDPQTEAVQFRLWREAAVWHRLEMVDGLIDSGRTLALAGLRLRHPQATDTELRRLLADLLLGHDVAAEVYGPVGEPAQVSA